MRRRSLHVASAEGSIRLTSKPALTLLAVFLLLTVVHTWPLATAPGTLTRHDNADTFLNQWTLAWVAHAVVHQPLQIFDANIFYPARHSLAFSEHLIPQGLLGAPVAWLGGSPVLVFNLVLMAGFVLTGWATALVVAQWTGDWVAGALAGSVAAFNTHALSRMVHVQAVHVEFLPLAFFALDRLLRSPTVRHACALAGWATLQMLCSGYLLVFTAFCLVSAAIVRPHEWLSSRGTWRTTALLAAAGCMAALACFPFLLPYATVREEQHLTRAIDEVWRYSAHLVDYVTTVGNYHFNWWSHRFYRGTDALFPGAVPVALAAVAMFSGVAWRDRRARMVLAAGVTCFVLSFGPATPIYVVLYRFVPLLEGLRGAARFGYIVIVGVGILGAFGLVWLRNVSHSVRIRRVVTTLGVLAVAMCNLEALVAPHDFTTFRGISPAYEALARVERAVVVEFPFWAPGDVARNGSAVLSSTRSWPALLNGYSGFVPVEYVRIAERLETFPDDRSLALLRELAVTHVVVHLDRDPELAERLTSIPELTQVAEHEDIRIYRFGN